MREASWVKENKNTPPCAVPLAGLSEKVPKLFGIPSGVPGLDELFFTFQFENDQVKRVPLNGLPSSAVIHLTGVPDTGKSLIGEQFSITQASRGYNVLYVTVEIPAPFLAQSFIERSKALKVEWDNIKDRIFILDTVKYPELRDNVNNLCQILAETIENKEINVTIIDSITGLYEGREMMARSVVRKLYEIMKKYYQSAIFISQKRSSHEEASAEAAGGYAVPHIVDCTIVLSKIVLTSKVAATMYGRKPGEVLRTIRIDGCRMCGHDSRVHLLEINEFGILQVGKPLAEVLR
nr:MAG: KaiC domain-containing protein [Bacillota bacterium]